MATENQLNNKMIAKNTVFLYLRMMFTMVVSLYTSRVVLNTLGVEDFGIYNVVGSIVSMFVFLNTTMASTVQRYLSFDLGKGDKFALNKSFCMSVNIQAIFAFVVVVIAETIGLWFVCNKLIIPAERLTAAVWVYHLSIASTIFVIMSVPYNAVIIAREKMSAFAYISIVEVLLKLIIVYVLTISPIDKLILYGILLLIIQGLLQLVYIVYCRKYFDESKYTKLQFDKKLFTEMFGFTGWNLLECLACIAYTQGVAIILNMFFGPVVNAARGIAYQVNHAVKGFCQNFQIAVNPQLVKSYAQQDFGRLHSLMCMSSKYSFFLVYIFALPIMIATDQILELWLKVVPEHSVSFLRLVFCAGMAESISNPIVTAARATGNIKRFQIVSCALMILIIPSTYLCLKSGLPPESAFVLLFLVLSSVLIARIILIKNLINLPILIFIKNVLLKVAIVAMITPWLPLYLYHFMKVSLVNLFFFCSFTVIFVLLTIYFVGITSKERQMTKGKIIEILNKIKKK